MYRPIQSVCVARRTDGIERACLLLWRYGGLIVVVQHIPIRFAVLVLDVVLVYRGQVIGTDAANERIGCSPFTTDRHGIT